MLPSEKRQTYSDLDKRIYLEGQPEGLVGGPAGGDDGVEGLEQGHAVGLTLLPLNVPSLKSPWSLPMHQSQGLVRFEGFQAKFQETMVFIRNQDSVLFNKSS